MQGIKKQFILSLIILIIPAPGLRAEGADSLISLLDSSRIDSVQVDLRLKIADEISNAEIKTALSYAREALRYSEILDSPYLIADSKLAIGSFYDYLGVREEALNHLMEAMNTFARLGDAKKEARSLMLIGNIFFYLEQYESSLKYFKSASEDAALIGDTFLIIGTMNSVGAAYGNTGRQDSAMLLFREANALARQTGSREQEILTFYNMGDLNLYRGNVDDALGIFYDLEQNYELESYSSKYLGSLYNSMTRAFIEKGDLKWARRYSVKSLMALNTYTRLTETMDYYLNCYRIDTMAGNLRSALTHYQIYNELGDSLKNASFQERLLNMEIYFDIQARDAEIKRLTLDNQLKDLQIWQRRTVNYAAMGGFLLLLTIIFLVIANTMRTRSKNKLLLEQKKELEKANELISAQSETLREKNTELESVIEELKATQQHLVQSEKMASLGTLTAGIAHEINNPLNFISGGLGIIREAEQNEGKLSEKEKEERKGKAIKMAFDGLERATGIVRALMTFSHKGTSKKAASDLHEIINNTLLFLHSRIKESIDIQKDYRLDHPVNVYPEKMHQVIMNILDNAIHAVGLSGDQGLINICTCKKDDVVVLEISNNGPLIKEEIIGKLFDPFFTTKEPGEGTGLGLSISYTLISDHGGNIRAENREDGVAFIIEIPA